MKKTVPFQEGTPAHVAIRNQTRSRCILVADDDPFMHELYAAVLTPSGYRVDTAKDGAAAWEALCANNYDLLITDNSMPKISGMELLEKLRAARMTLPAIMVSGTLPSEPSTLHLAATLLKPVSPEKLLENVEEVLRAAHMNACIIPAPNQSLPKA